MKIINLVQGTPEWHAHRSQHFNASDAPAMLGISPYKTRTELLDEMATGITKEIDDATQQRFNDGHRFEALARPLAEKIIGEELSPVTGTRDEYSASFDGITFDQIVWMEHKSLNEELREILSRPDVTGADLPEYYQVQMEHQAEVCEGEKCLFMASKWGADGNLIEELHCWYYPNPELRKRIGLGWIQFKKDLATHQPKAIAERPQAQVSIELPTLFVHAHGEITDSNMEAFGLALTAKLAEVRAIKLIDDQDFSNAKESAKLFREQAKKLKLAKEAMLAQTVTIGEASRMIDGWAEDLNKTALQLEKDVEREDLAKKRAMTSEASLAFVAHVEALETETRPIHLDVPRPDFAAAIKGKRNYTSMHDAIQTMLAQCKSQADAVAQDVRNKLAWFDENAKPFAILFELQQIIGMERAAFEAVVKNRIAEQQTYEAKRLEAERERIRIEEEAKARAKVEAEAQPVRPAAPWPSSPAPLDKQEAARVAIEAGAEPAVRPSRESLIKCIAFEYGVEVATAEVWLSDAFSEVAA